MYDSATTAAVKKFQAKYGMVVDGLVGTNMLTVLSGQIVVDIGSLRLYLYSDGQLVKSYPVATGQPAYPTPTGTYSIVNMQKDPTWLPPNSDWAKNATPIEPGTANPLGTRWMGTSAPGVGMHGVPPSEDCDHRHLRFARLHPHAQLGRRRPLQPCRRGDAGHHPPVA